MKSQWKIAASLVAFMFLVGCSGGYGGGSDGASSGGGAQARSMEEHFTHNVQPSLEFCRTCHVPGGVADVENGRGFQLSSNKSQDLANLKASWERLGGNNPTSRILLMASGQETPHSGGAPWAQGSAGYRNMEILLKCFGDPAGCASLLAGGVSGGTLLPLLGSSHAKSLWVSYCEGKPDEAALPDDPRWSVQPGANAGKAVHFNISWDNCHANAEEKDAAPKTCGVLRSRIAAGEAYFRERNFIGDLSLPAPLINSLWTAWGLTSRPENFDAMLGERYGLNPSPYPNPYPLPGEDPKTTNGGSGQLPMGLAQSRDANGQYTGRISVNCFTCHGGKLGEPGDGTGLGSIPGLHNTNGDLQMLVRDLGGGAPGLLPIALNPQRGTNDAVTAFELVAVYIADIDSLDLRVNPLSSPQNHPSADSTEASPWWNTSHRTRKFVDAGPSMDSTRIDGIAGTGLNVLSLNGKQRREVLESYDQDLEAYVESLEAPRYPGAIDTALAEQGAVLFHSKNLWAENLNNPVRRPDGGNGSCASCHGAYSPRYVNDPAFLDNPAWEGIASNLSPLDLIGTDTIRADFASPTLREGWGTSWWGYPEEAPGYVSPDEKNPLVEILDDQYPMSMRPQGACGWLREPGYQAPPLYGVWASAPYLHNGSVPTVWDLLKPADRPKIWARPLSTKVAGNEHGFDMSLAGYDLGDKLGVKYRSLDCGEPGTTAYLTCVPNDPDSDGLLNTLLNALRSNVFLSGFISVPAITREQVEARKIFDTHRSGNGNEGHEFVDVLTDPERRAIIEYLKTL